mmetsp:Transcript_50499/g.126794  ORF Transcript_50499/g.126794 Transcript_50499/m.126794 type:complete len:203 (+) Transcript_50499:774-1382(+)
MEGHAKLLSELLSRTAHFCTHDVRACSNNCRSPFGPRIGRLEALNSLINHRKKVGHGLQSGGVCQVAQKDRQNHRIRGVFQKKFQCILFKPANRYSNAVMAFKMLAQIKLKGSCGEVQSVLVLVGPAHEVVEETLLPRIGAAQHKHRGFCHVGGTWRCGNVRLLCTRTPTQEGCVLRLMGLQVCFRLVFCGCFLSYCNEGMK